MATRRPLQVFQDDENINARQVSRQTLKAGMTTNRTFGEVNINTFGSANPPPRTQKAVSAKPKTATRSRRQTTKAARDYSDEIEYVPKPKDARVEPEKIAVQMDSLLFSVPGVSSKHSFDNSAFYLVDNLEHVDLQLDSISFDFAAADEFKIDCDFEFESEMF